MPSSLRRLNRREWLRRAGGLAAGAAISLGGAGRRVQAQAPRPPNIVIVNCDDLGYGDLGCYGANKIRTPHLDLMACQGARFTDFYSCAAVCTPSRAGLMTGRYAIRVGLPNVLSPNSKIGISDNELTLGEAVKARGYATACIGKWHLGDLPQFRPTRHGFDYYFGLLYSNDMKPTPLYRNDEVAEDPAEQSTLTERYTQEAIQFIERSRQQPFLLYLAHTMPHVPLHVSERFAGKSEGGKYGDVVECIDWSVGEVFTALDRLGLGENTLVMFTSDNGPWLEQGANGGSAGPLRAGKGTVYEGGVRVPFLARWPDRIPLGTICHEPAAMMDIYATSLALAGAELPTDRPVDGKDILPLMTGKGKSPHDLLVFYLGSELWAARAGRWKIHLHKRVTVQEGGKQVTRAVALAQPELYDLEADIGEQNDVGAQQAEVVREMQQKVAAFEEALRKGKQ